MVLHHLPFELQLFWIVDTLWVDFLLAFTTFAGIAYAVLHERLAHRRPAAAVAAAFGFALAVGLVWWEYDHGLSVRNLGPIAIGFAVLLLGGVIHWSLKLVAGRISSAAFAVIACIAIAWALGAADWVQTELVALVLVAAAVLAVGSLLAHRAHHPVGRPQTPGSRRYATGLRDTRNMAGRITRRLSRVRRKIRGLRRHPDRATGVMIRLRQVLPEEGRLTSRLSQLRARAHHIRQGNVARIQEVREAVGRLPKVARRKAGEELAARYQELQLDVRMERLDRTAAAIEQRVRELTLEAGRRLADGDRERAEEMIQRAVKLQRQESRLLKLIERTERRIQSLARETVEKHAEVSGG